MPKKQLITEALAATKLPSVHITAVKETAGLLDSKFAGDFYLPEGAAAPVCPEGEAMRCLAQINLAQTPALPGFPQSGILQFFIDANADRFFDKLDAGEKRRELYALRYYPQPAGDWQQSAGLHNTDDYPQSPGGDPWLQGKMQFAPADEVATIEVSYSNTGCDFGYGDAIKLLKPALLKRAGYDFINTEADADAFAWDFGNWGCKIGGHPALRQGDIRCRQAELQAYTTLLFQYDLTTRDLENDTFIFLIKPADLQAGRFADVLLDWHNCY